jgi:hypothetical protein
MTPLSAGDRGLGRLVLPLGVAALVLAVIGPTVMPGLGLWDTGEFQTVPPILGTMHPTGYPTYVLVGFALNLLLTPLGEPAFRMNLLSLLAVAAAAAFAALTIKLLTGRTLIAAAVGIGLGLTPIAWSIATRADAHALHLALVALLLALLARWEHARREAEDPPDATRRGDRWLVSAAIVYGLAAGNHSLTLLLALPILLYVLAVEPNILRRPRFMATCALAAIGTLALVYLELPLRAGPFRAPLVYANPETWDGFWYIALAEQFRGILGNPLADLPEKAAKLVQLGVRELGPLAIVVPVGFLATVARAPRFALLTGSAFLITVLFNASYTNADLSRYYLGPALIAWLWIGLFAATIIDGIVVIGADVGPDAEVVAAPAGRRRLVEIALSTALAAGLLVPTALGYTTRSATQDRSGDVTARVFLDAMFESLPQDSVVISWWSYSTPLWYGTYVEGRRTDIKVIDDRTLLDEHLGEAWDAVGRFIDDRPVYVIRANGHDLDLILERFDLEPLDDLRLAGVWHVVGRRAAGG